MNIEDIRQKYQCDASQTFAQWKEWVRKNKPSQAQAHIVKAVAPNGSKYERLIGGYTDAQNVAFDLASHGYKDVKLYHSVNAGPLKFLRNFSAPLHGAKFKDSLDSVDEIFEKYCIDFVMKNDIVRLPNMASYDVEIKINGQPFFPMMTVRDVEGAKKDKIAKQAMEQFKKFHWNNSNSFNRPLDKSKAKLTVGKIKYKPDGRSNWEVMR